MIFQKVSIDCAVRGNKLKLPRSLFIHLVLRSRMAFVSLTPAPDPKQVYTCIAKPVELGLLFL
ncbi:hypothetical protein PHET_11419 [Paragonimus heterotremus]|uniref:Uncharacterized protein n=1 Tax=Paragonimus heterotremus TaxID=100268 RepID=A0A8J4T0Y7_9TREM|nr:hypothetical protein PHET_11419 [Paragonimus heterotremus]